MIDVLTGAQDSAGAQGEKPDAGTACRHVKCIKASRIPLGKRRFSAQCGNAAEADAGFAAGCSGAFIGRNKIKIISSIMMDKAGGTLL